MDNLINEGGNAKAKNGATASKISLADFTPEQYGAFKHGLLNLVYDLNKAFTKFAKEPLFPSEDAISSLKIFSGSGFEFFNRNREEYVKVKPKMGDVDVQIDENKREKVRAFLQANEGKKFAGFTYLGTQFGGDFYNIFEAPKQFQPAAQNIQMDFEFIEYDENGMPNEFDVFSKNSDWEDLSQGIKGLAKNNLLPVIYKVVYATPGVVFQNKKDEPSKAFKDDTVPTKSYGNKGSRQKYQPVKDAEGNQVMYDGKPAFREYAVKDTPLNRDLNAIFTEMFGVKPTPKTLKMMYSYNGVLHLMNKFLTKQQIQKIYQLYSKDLYKQVDDPTVSDAIVAKFKEVCPFVHDVNEKMTLGLYYKKLILGE